MTRPVHDDTTTAPAGPFVATARAWHLSCEAYRDEPPDLWRWIASLR